jgi:hypothetical protein
MSVSLTATIKDRLKFPNDNTLVKNLISDEIRGLIRQYGISGESDPMWIRLQYEILFVDPITSRPLGQFQGMWQHRGAHKSTHEGDWWWAFYAYLKDTCEKVKVATNWFHEWKRVEYESWTPGFYDSPNFNWPAILSVTRTPTWFPVTGTNKRPTEIPDNLFSAARTAKRPPPGNAPTVILPAIAKIRIFIVNPDDFEAAEEPDYYGLFSMEVGQFLITITSYSLHAIWTAVRGQLTQAQYPRVLYGCALLPANPTEVARAGAVPRRDEGRANTRVMTYEHDISTATQLTNDGEVQAWINSTIGPIRGMICILRRAGRDNTPPRDANVHFNEQGTLCRWRPKPRRSC